MPDQIWLLDGDRAKNIIPKRATSAVIIDDVALSADASGSFEPARILEVSDSRLRHAVRVGRVMKIFIEGRTRAELSLSGTSDALTALSPCLRRLSDPVDNNGTPSISRPKQEKAAKPHSDQLGQPESCSGIYAYLDARGEHPQGLSVEVTTKAVDVQFSDYSSLFGRAQTQPDGSVFFNEGRGDPMWTLRCYSEGALLVKPGDQWSGERVYTLERTTAAEIFDYAARKGFDLTH
tara:strand:+ start:623 stop:1327 length:705 start_codon:yes stop_codon:yes gene_type:complete